MAIVSSKLHWKGWTGSDAIDGKREAKAVYIVQTDDPNDGWLTVVENYGGPQAGEFGYQVGNDVDNNLLCVEVDPQRQNEDNGRILWHVVASFKYPDDQPVDSQGQPSGNPIDWLPEITITPQTILKPVEKAKNVTAFPGRPADTEGPVTSSAHEVFVPAPEKEHTRWLYSIRSNHAIIPIAHHGLQNTINSDVITLQILRPNGLELVDVFNKFELKVEAFTLKSKYERGVPYWEASLDLLFDKDTWRPEYLDKGVFAVAGDGDPDGHGGTFVADEQQAVQGQHTVIEAGAAPVRRILDPLGRPVGAPVLLDGEGKPLDAGAEPVYLKYKIYPEMALQNHITVMTKAF